MSEYISTALALFFLPGALHSAEAVTATESDWKGYPKQSFDFEGHKAFVVVPQEAAPGKPWVWRTSFPDFHAEVDLELVKGEISESVDFIRKHATAQ